MRTAAGPCAPCTAISEPLPRLPTSHAPGLGFAEGRPAALQRGWLEPTDALRLGAARELPASAGARGHTGVLLLPRLISPTDISGHHFVVCWISPAPLPAGARAAPPPSAAPGRAGSARTGRGRCAELSPLRSRRLGNWAVGEAAGWPLSLALLVVGNFISESHHSLQTEAGALGRGEALAAVTRRSRC